jgi:hypothetical protein
LDPAKPTVARELSLRKDDAMQRVVLGMCLFAAACGSQSSSSPTAPSAVTSPAGSSVSAAAPLPVGSSAQAANVEVTFTKWVTAYPDMAGFTGGDVVGTYEGEVLSRTAFDNGVVVQLEARYAVIDPNGLHSFTTVIQGKSAHGTAVLNGVVTEGWMVGARTHVTFETITPCEFGLQNVCFRGTIRVLPGSAK